MAASNRSSSPGTYPSSNNDADIAAAHQLESFERMNFAEKIHCLLSIPAYSSILRWNSEGDAFSIEDQEAFTSVIMPKHFEGAKFESFTRRMRRWGFRRIETTKDKVNGVTIYKNKLFLQNNPESCKMMCDDRQWKTREWMRNRARNGGTNSPETVERLLASARADYPAPNPNPTIKKLGKGQKELEPIHYPGREAPLIQDQGATQGGVEKRDDLDQGATQGGVEKRDDLSPIYYSKETVTDSYYWGSGKTSGYYNDALPPLPPSLQQVAATQHSYHAGVASAGEPVELHPMGLLPSPYYSQGYSMNQGGGTMALPEVIPTMLSPHSSHQDYGTLQPASLLQYSQLEYSPTSLAYSGREAEAQEAEAQRYHQYQYHDYQHVKDDQVPNQYERQAKERKETAVSPII